MAGRLLEDFFFFFKKRMQERAGMGYCPFLVSSRDLKRGSRQGGRVVRAWQASMRTRPSGFSQQHLIASAHAHDLGAECATWARQGEVATWFRCRDLDLQGWCRNILLVSRHD